MEKRQMSNETIQLNDRSAFKHKLNEGLSLPPSETVAIGIDLQREYLDESVGQAVLKPDDAARVVDANAKLFSACRDAGIPVIHAYVVRREEEAERDFHTGGLAYMLHAHSVGASQVPHRPARVRVDRVEGTPEAEVPSALLEPGDVHVTQKKSLDSFMGTDLGFLLGRIFRPKYLLMTGINTDTCVYSTTFSAANQGYAPVVVSDCVFSSRGADSHAMALELMARSIAWVMPSDDVVAAFED